MNYQYQFDQNGKIATYTVNGETYSRLADVPAEHRAYFANIDKNNNGIPDQVEPFMDLVQNSNYKPSAFSVLRALFSLVRTEFKNNNKTIETTAFEEVKEVKKETPVFGQTKSAYNQQGGVMQQGESSFIPTLIKILLVILILLTGAWYFGWIH